MERAGLGKAGVQLARSKSNCLITKVFEREIDKVEVYSLKQQARCLYYLGTGGRGEGAGGKRVKPAALKKGPDGLYAAKLIEILHCVHLLIL